MPNEKVRKIHIKPVNTQQGYRKCGGDIKKICIQRKSHNRTTVKINEHIIHIKKVKKVQ